MHLKDELVLRVLKLDHRCGVAGGDPAPGTGPGVALRGDVLLGGACSADTVDTSLVQVDYVGLIHIMKFVINIKYNELVVLVLRGDGGPPFLEARSVGDNLAVETAVVVWLDHGVGTLRGDVVHKLGKVSGVVGVQGAGEPAGCQALHQEVDAEEVHALCQELVNLLGVDPDVVLVVETGKVSLAKLWARLVDAEPFQLATGLAC